MVEEDPAPIAQIGDAEHDLRDLEERRRSFLPTSGSGLAAEPAMSGSGDERSTESRESDEEDAPRGDGSGSYWDVSRRVLPRHRDLGNSEERPADPEASYWVKSRRRW
jgi:hypothetical protein